MLGELLERRVRLGLRRAGPGRLARRSRHPARARPAGLAIERPRAVALELSDLALGPTAFLFEGFPRAGVDVSNFVTRTPPGRAVELHVHPYAETFLPLAGRGRWTRGEETVELEPEGMLVVPPDTPHGFRKRRRRAAPRGVRPRARHPAPDLARRGPGLRRSSGPRPVSRKPRPRKTST